MGLIFISLVLGFLGFSIGASLGGAFLGGIFGIIGALSPSLFVLEKIYKGSIGSNEFSKQDYQEALDGLKASGILTDLESEKASLKLNESSEKNEDKIKYDKAVDILYMLSERDVISEEEFHEKIRLIKILYKHK